MSRNHLHRTPRRRAPSWIAAGVAAFATAIGAALFAPAPASAEHVEGAVAGHVARVAVSHFALAHEILFGPPVVEVHHYGPPPHRHHARCGHGYHGKRHYKHHRGHHYRHHAKHHRGHHTRDHRGHGRHHARGYRDDYARYEGHRRTIPRHERREVMHRRGGRH